MKNKGLVAITALLAAVSIFAVFFTRGDIENTSNISNFGEKEAFFSAENYLKNKGFDLEGYEFSYRISTNRARDAFFSKNFSKDEADNILKSDNSSEFVYFVRAVKNLEKEEYSVTIDPKSDRIIGFKRTVGENKKEKETSKKEAETLAKDFLKSSGYNLSEMKLLDYSEKTFPDRTERRFSFKIDNTERSSDYGNFFKKVSVTVSGENIYSFGESYFIPEKFTRDILGEKSYGFLFSMFSLLASLLMVIAAIVVFFKKVYKKNIRWRIFLGLSIFLFLFFMLDFFNGINLFKNTALTVIDFKVAFITSFIIAIAISTILAAVVYVVGSAGDYYNKKDKKVNNFLKATVNVLRSKETSFSIFVGYLLAIVLLGVTSLIYFIGEKYFGVWYFGNAETLNIFTSAIPALSIFVGIALFPAIFEEFLYRFFGVRFFEKLTKSIWLGVLISSLIWALSHLTYDVFPFYFRGIELLIVGSLLGFYFIRFGIFTTITAHYVYNSLLVLIGSYFIVGVFNFWLIVFVVLMPAVLAVFPFILGSLNNKHEEGKI